MGEKTYYFPALVENDSLCSLAQKAKEVLQETDKVAKTFHKYDVLSRESLRQYEFLMTLNDKSFSYNDSCRSRSSETQHGDAKSEEKPEQQLPAVIRNPNSPDFSRRHLHCDQAEKENYEPEELNSCSSKMRQAKNINPNKENEFSECPFVGKTAADDQKLVCFINSNEAEIFRNAELDNKESFLSAGKATIAVNHKADDESVSPKISKRTDKPQGNNQESLVSDEITMTASCNRQDKELANSVKITKKFDNQEKNNQKYKSSDQKAEIPDANCQMSNSQECIVSDETMIKMTNSAEGSQDSSSFVNRSEKKFLSADDKMTTSPNVELEIDELSEVQEKYPYPWRSSVFSASIPRVKRSNGILEIVVSSSEALGNPSSKSSRILPNGNKVDQKAKVDKRNIRIAAVQDPNLRTVSTGVNGPCIMSPRKLEATNIPGKDNIFPETYGKSVSLTRAIMSAGYRSGVNLPPPIINYSDPNIVLEYMSKFVKFSEKRIKAMREIHNSFLHFQNHLLFLHSYVKDIEHIIRNIPAAEMEYSTEEFQDFKSEAISSKLMKKLSSWEKDVQTDIAALNQCFQQIQELRSRNELIIIKGMPIVSIHFLRMYANKLKGIWEKMDDMVTRGYSRSSLFFNTAHDFERLITNFVKCLIVVEILKPRISKKK